MDDATHDGQQEIEAVPAQDDQNGDKGAQAGNLMQGLSGQGIEGGRRRSRRNRPRSAALS